MPAPAFLLDLRRRPPAPRGRLYQGSFPIFWIHTGKLSGDVLIDLGGLASQSTQTSEGNPPGGKVLNSMLRAIEFLGERLVNDRTDRLTLFCSGDFELPEERLRNFEGCFDRNHKDI